MKISHLLTRKADTFSFFNDLHVHYGRCPFIKFKPKNNSLTTEFTEFFYLIILVISLCNVFFNNYDVLSVFSVANAFS